MVGFDGHKKVNRKMLGCHPPPTLCLINRQIDASSLWDWTNRLRKENCPQSYPPKMWRRLASSRHEVHVIPQRLSLDPLPLSRVRRMDDRFCATSQVRWCLRTSAMALSASGTHTGMAISSRLASGGLTANMEDFAHAMRPGHIFPTRMSGVFL